MEVGVVGVVPGGSGGAGRGERVRTETRASSRARAGVGVGGTNQGVFRARDRREGGGGIRGR